MIQYGLTIDPGLSNGACFFSFGDEQPFRQEALYQFEYGAEGLAAWMNRHMMAVTRGRGVEPYVTFEGRRLSALVVEKFTPRDHDNFSLTLKSVEPLRGEGVLIGQAFGPFIDWQQPAAQYFMGDSRMTLAQKKKTAREFLKLHGLYVTGKHVGQKDADDAISAELHAIAWLRKKKHLPTLEALFGSEGV
jgi:hypothetical protein